MSFCSKWIMHLLSKKFFSSQETNFLHMKDANRTCSGIVSQKELRMTAFFFGLWSISPHPTPIHHPSTKYASLLKHCVLVHEFSNFSLLFHQLLIFLNFHNFVINSLFNSTLFSFITRASKIHLFCIFFRALWQISPRVFDDFCIFAKEIYL